MTRKQEILSLILECFKLGYSKEFLIEELSNKKSYVPAATKRCRAMATDIINNELKAAKYYADMYGVTTNRIYSHYDFFINRMNVLIHHAQTNRKLLG